jgi:probable rRNA maturation factor
MAARTPSRVPPLAAFTAASRCTSRHARVSLLRRFGGRANTTSVLTFATGDIVLCDPVVHREARAGQSLAAHYAHLVVHGALHLQGHDHLKKKDAARMERAEVRVLRRLGFANPYE